MDATTMASKNLVGRLAHDFPHLAFTADEVFFWSPRLQSVFYGPIKTEDDHRTLLHETAHGLLGHENYEHDVELIRIEREAWNKARELAPIYGINISDAHIETALDTYRDWLHSRSLCPTCRQTGVQESESAYTCLLCHIEWRVNDARNCGLKRYLARP